MEKKFFDFTGDQAFDLNEEYKTLFGTEEFIKDNKSEHELKHAEKIIAEDAKDLVEGTTLNNFEVILNNINHFFQKYRTDSTEVSTMTKSDRDKLFGYGKELFNAFKQSYEELAFNFDLSVKEWAFLEHTLTKKLSYNGQELFTYWELYSKWIEPTSNIAKQLPKDIPSFVPSIPVRNLVLLQHLIFKHSEVPSTVSFYSFKKICFEIAKMTKLFNAYGVLVVRVENRFTHWIDAINSMDGYNEDREPKNIQQG